MGDWKLIEWFETGRLELYNLQDDLSEASDVSDSNPKKREQLYERMQAWRKAVAAPIPTTPNPNYTGATSSNKKNRKQRK